MKKTELEGRWGGLRRNMLQERQNGGGGSVGLWRNNVLESRKTNWVERKGAVGCGGIFL